MKKRMAFAMIFICVLSLTGCGSQTYQLPHDQFCYVKANSQPVELCAEDQQFIINLLNNASWRNDVSNCIVEYVFYTQQQKLHYCAECGLFNDVTAVRSTVLTEQQRQQVNKMLHSGDWTDVTPTTKYSIDIQDNYPILNQLEPAYAAGETVTVQLPTVTEHYYILTVNGQEQKMDMDTSDLAYTYFTFTMPEEDAVIQIVDRWVDIPNRTTN